MDYGALLHIQLSYVNIKCYLRGFGLTSASLVLLTYTMSGG